MARSNGITDTDLYTVPDLDDTGDRAHAHGVPLDVADLYADQIDGR